MRKVLVRGVRERGREDKWGDADYFVREIRFSGWLVGLGITFTTKLQVTLRTGCKNKINHTKLEFCVCPHNIMGKPQGSNHA